MQSGNWDMSATCLRPDHFIGRADRTHRFFPLPRTLQKAKFGKEREPPLGWRVKA